jgi:dolichyl-phosphate-mannose--protein O-mannosyl transferase
MPRRSCDVVPPALALTCLIAHAYHSDISFCEPEEGSMEGSTGRGFLTWIHRKTPPRMNTYTAYSIGTFVAWAVIWAILAATEKKVTLGYIFAIFFGWCIGWLSATIARAVYPPPKKVYLTGDPRQP